MTDPMTTTPYPKRGVETSTACDPIARAAPVRRGRHDAAQTTAEYALVLLGAATVALLLVAWATGTDTITRLLDAVLDAIIGRVT